MGGGYVIIMPEEASRHQIKSPGAGVSGLCEQPAMVLGVLWTICKSSVSLTTEPCL